MSAVNSRSGCFSIQLTRSSKDLPTAIRSFFLDRASHCGNGSVEKLTTSLRAFLRNIAPFRPFRKGDGISSVVKRLMQRAGADRLSRNAMSG